jgi:S1-C subfamily serine protease
LLEVDGQPIHGIADLRVALWDKKPGDRVRLSVRQKPRAGTTRSYAIELTAPAKPAGKS